jgi:hypothetical protein
MAKSRISQMYNSMKLWLYLKTKDKWLSYKRKNLRPLNKIEYKADIVNWLARQFNYNSYLQISTYSTGNYFDEIDSNLFSIRSCLNYKVGNINNAPIGNVAIRNDHQFYVEDYDVLKERYLRNDQKYDIVFVDSYHTFDQTTADLALACELVSERGLIIVHDCKPEKKESTGNQYHRGAWLGQSYEAFIKFRYQNLQHNCFVIDTDYGCGVIQKNVPTKKHLEIPENAIIDEAVEWSFFEKHYVKLLDLVSIDEFKLKHCSKHFLSQTLICIVLYETNIEESFTYKSLLEANVGSLGLNLLLFDNSPEAQKLSENNQIQIEYHQSDTNVGIAGAYNYAAKRAKEMKMEWLIFFDQDSYIPKNFFDKLAISKQENPSQELFVPLVKDSDAIVSPSYPIFDRLSPKRYFSGLTKVNEGSIINSGMMVSLRVFEELGGYHPELPMYYSDTYFFHRYKQKYTNFVLHEAILQHEMRLSSKQLSEVKLTFKALFDSTKKYAQLIKSPKPIISYFKMGVWHTLRFKDLSFLKIGLINILKNR